MRYRCPECKGSDHLWQFVDVDVQDAWQDVDEHLHPSGRVQMEDADVDVIGSTGRFGCAECDWRGLRDDLEQIGIDGNPLPVVHIAQLRLAS